MNYDNSGSIRDANYAASSSTHPVCKADPLYSADLDAQNELTRISCYLAGEIEVPDHVPVWKVLYGPLSEVYRKSNQQQVKAEVRNANDCPQLRPRAEKRKLEPKKHQAKKPSIRTDIDVPLEWDSCFSRLWHHVTKHSIINDVLQRDAFAERLRRIGDLARRSLEERGFFTLKNLLGPEHASQICQWAWNQWRTKPHLFRPGKVSVNDSTSSAIRRDLVTWINPECPAPSATDSEMTNVIPYVQLLFLYIDAVVRAVGSRIQNRYGEWAVVNGKSWANISSYCKQSESTKDAVGYVAHYDNPDTLCDGRILTALYYLNPRWERAWGGQFVLWPNQDNALSPKSESSSSSGQTKPLAILPTLDRFVLFFADQRILHCVQPVLACSPQNERLAIGIWYFDRYEREAFLRSQVV